MLRYYSIKWRRRKSSLKDKDEDKDKDNEKIVLGSVDLLKQAHKFLNSLNIEGILKIYIKVQSQSTRLYIGC